MPEGSGEKTLDVEARPRTVCSYYRFLGDQDVRMLNIKDRKAWGWLRTKDTSPNEWQTFWEIEVKAGGDEVLIYFPHADHTVLKYKGVDQETEMTTDLDAPEAHWKIDKSLSWSRPDGYESVLIRSAFNPQCVLDLVDMNAPRETMTRTVRSNDYSCSWYRKQRT